MKTVAEVIGVSRSNLVERMRLLEDLGFQRLLARAAVAARSPAHDKLVAEIKAVIAELQTYGSRRVHAILNCQALAAGLTSTPAAMLPEALAPRVH